MDIPRRAWLAAGLGWAGGEALEAAWQHAHAASGGGTALRVLTRREADELQTLTAGIVPSDDGPGAREAGVVYFIDAALASFDADRRPDYRKGLAEVRRAAARLFPGKAGIGGLTREQVGQLLTNIEKTEFFQLLRTHTVLGFLGSPSYGGNRGGAGWAYIGFEDRMAFEPPFGYYDARPEGE